MRPITLPTSLPMLPVTLRRPCALGALIIATSSLIGCPTKHPAEDVPVEEHAPGIGTTPAEGPDADAIPGDGPAGPPEQQVEAPAPTVTAPTADETPEGG